MAYAITHFFTSVFLAVLLKSKFSEINKYIHVKELFIIGLFGILPDIDVFPFIINSYLNLGWSNIHRLITHNLTIATAIFLIGLFLYFKNKPELRISQLGPANKSSLGKWGLIFMLGGIGWSSHLFLDWLLSGTITPFYPFSNFETGINIIPENNLRLGSYVLGGIDAAVLLTWSWFAILKETLKDFQVW